MTIISHIKRLSHPGVLREFAWSENLSTFNRYNLIYGWNGSGKTTISRLFRALETRLPPTDYEVILSIKGSDVSGTAFSESKIPVRVFNRDFISESVFPVLGGEVPPILVLGKEDVDKQKQVEKLKKNITAAESTLSFARLEKAKTEKDLDRYCIDQATLIRKTLSSSGSNRYNNYDKSDFRQRAQKMVAEMDKDAHLLSESDRDKLLSQHRAIPKLKLKESSYRLPNLTKYMEDAEKLLATTVVSVAIQKLQNDRDLFNWVGTGLKLHRSRKTTTCLFCEQDLTQERFDLLEAHFNAEYEQVQELLDENIKGLQIEEKAADNLRLPNSAELYEDLSVEYRTAERLLNDTIHSIKKVLGFLMQVLTGKKSQPFDKLALNITMPQIDVGIVDSLNNIIRNHNQASDEFESRTVKARQRLETDFVAQSLDEIQRRVSDDDTANRLVKQSGDERSLLEKEIKRLEREIVEHRQPAEDLNEDLRKYLGHSELSLKIEETGYTLMRNGEVAHLLSEGETTAIALLYFLKSLQDRRFDLTNGVVVLDDPVSSLDANSLYLAFAFIRDYTENAAQLFILTHNFAFFREVRNWFHNLKGQKKKNISQRPAQFYMLDCANSGDQRCSRLQRLDPLLEQYESEYHYLFSRIYREANNPTPAPLEQSYILPNMARRLVEAFLAFRQPQGAGDLWKKFKNLKLDDVKKFQILRFLHTHSHSGAIVNPQHDESFLSEAPSVLKNVLELMEVEDHDHYTAMVKLVETPAEEEKDE